MARVAAYVWLDVTVTECLTRPYIPVCFLMLPLSCSFLLLYSEYEFICGIRCKFRCKEYCPSIV